MLSHPAKMQKTATVLIFVILHILNFDLCDCVFKRLNQQNVKKCVGGSHVFACIQRNGTLQPQFSISTNYISKYTNQVRQILLFLNCLRIPTRLQNQLNVKWRHNHYCTPKKVIKNSLILAINRQLRTQQKDLFLLLFSLFPHSLAGELEETETAKTQVLKHKKRYLTCLTSS